MVTTTGTRLPRLNARRTSSGTTMPTLLPPVGSRTVRKVVMAKFLSDSGSLRCVDGVRLGIECLVAPQPLRSSALRRRSPAMSVPPAVGDDDVAGRCGDLVDQGQASGVVSRLEEPPTGPRHDRMDREGQPVEDPGVEELAHH